MFDNKFLKHDPLVEAVKQAQADGDLRRRAEAAVNEAFGVYSRKAVIRENLAAYDAALEETYKSMKEGKLADKDYDKDGKVESPKDEVWGSRLRAARMAGKLKEGAIDAGSMEGSKSVTKSAPKEDPSTPKVPMSQLPKTGNRAGSVIDSAKGSLREAIATAVAQKMKHKDLKEPRHPNPGALTNVKGLGSIAEEDQLDELSRKTLGSYIKKAADDSSYHSFVAGGELGKRGNSNLRLASDRKAMKRLAGVNKAADKLAKEEWEGSKEDKSEDKKLAKKHGMTMDQWEKSAADKKHDAKEKMDEAAYSAKAARAGKDIGKPGKMFSKIAAKAGKKYGSAERGKAVAGAVLKRIRAKHMEESTQIDELVVQKSQMRPGETLGQTMNRLTGKTAIKGGANDPSSPKFKGSSTAPGVPSIPKQPGAPSETSTQSFLKGQGIGVKPPEQRAAPSMSMMDPKAASIKPTAPSAPVSNQSATSGNLPSMASGLPGSTGAKSPTLSPVAPKPMKGWSDPGAAENKARAAGALKESVQVGENSYRIV